MNISNTIAQMILDMLNEEGSAEMQRNELAQTLGCVPSQINYVISSRFTPERGFIVESRRGGGGYIRITRAGYDTGTSMIMHVINSVSQSIDEKSARAHIVNLVNLKLLPTDKAKLMLAATADICYKELEPEKRDATRAAVLKQMLIQTVK